MVKMFYKFSQEQKSKG